MRKDKPQLRNLLTDIRFEFAKRSVNAETLEIKEVYEYCLSQIERVYNLCETRGRF